MDVRDIVGEGFPKKSILRIFFPLSKAGSKSSPGKLLGPDAFAAASIVGTMSMLLHSSGRSEGAIFPGQENMIGVRVPAS